MVQIRERSTGGGNNDALLLLDSGSYYDWTDPQPVRIAWSYDRGSDTYKGSLNGQTMTATFENITLVQINGLLIYNQEVVSHILVECLVKRLMLDL